VYKITDFGVSSVGEFCQTFIGTPVYLAPEIMNNRLYNDQYDKAVDIWALGVLTFETYFGISPFFYSGTKLLTFNDFEIIMDNIITICTPKFDINTIIDKLRSQNLTKQADIIVEKLRKTSKHLIYLFSKFF
jgi:serine/threonine protein kinase